MISTSMLCNVYASKLSYPNSDRETVAVSRVREEVSLRESNAETYLLSDGSYECVVYANDKYFRDENGEYVQIENRIIDRETIINDISYDYSNKSGKGRIFHKC